MCNHHLVVWLSLSFSIFPNISHCLSISCVYLLKKNSFVFIICFVNSITKTKKEIQKIYISPKESLIQREVKKLTNQHTHTRTFNSHGCNQYKYVCLYSITHIYLYIHILKNNCMSCLPAVIVVNVILFCLTILESPLKGAFFEFALNEFYLHYILDKFLICIFISPANVLSMISLHKISFHYYWWLCYYLFGLLQKFSFYAFFQNYFICFYHTFLCTGCTIINV